MIAILAAVLFPVFSQAREKARQISCASNMRQINLGLLQYAQDNDERMPGDVQAPPINGSTTDDHTMPYDRQIAPYVKNDQVYACPDDSVPRQSAGPGDIWDGAYAGRNLKRSYGITNTLATQEGIDRGEKPDKNTGMVGTALAQIEQPAETISLSESWAAFPDGSSDSLIAGDGGSTLLDCDTWKLPGRGKPSTAPIDNFAPCGDYADPKNKPAAGHQNLGNYAFADGHVKALRWPQVRGNDFRLFKLHKPTQVFSP